MLRMSYDLRSFWRGNFDQGPSKTMILAERGINFMKIGKSKNTPFCGRFGGSGGLDFHTIFVIFMRCFFDHYFSVFL